MKTIITQLPNRRNYRKGRFTIEIGYPWLTWGAIMQAEVLIKPEYNVLELGCGGSTIFFSRRCKTVKSYETVLGWAGKVRSALPNPSNVVLILGSKEEVTDAVKKEPDECYDLLIGDMGESYEFRLKLINEAIPKLKLNGYMIIDNYELMTFDYTGWEVFTFDDIGYSGKGTRICIKR